MEVILLVVSAVLVWFLYRVLISGPGGKRSFLQFYRDQNEIRHDIQSKGGIHNVESRNIKDLESQGYGISGYGENFVELEMNNQYGKSRVSIIHGKDGKSIEVEFDNLSGDNILDVQSKMRSSNGAFDTLSRNITEILKNSERLSSNSKIKVLNHFRAGSSTDTDKSVI